MEKYNIKSNRPELSKAEIEEGMDFSKIQAKAGPGARIFPLKKVLLSGMAAAVIIAVGYFVPKMIDSGKGEVLTDKTILPTTANVPDTFVVNTVKDTTLVYTSGTKIKIPAGSFVDEKGEPVKGKVKINYREFHKVSEILLANIPMRYDSAGKEMYFESAGMFHITANQGEKPVYIAKDKSLEVAMATLDRADKKYNQYLLDEETGKWEYIKRDEVAVISKGDILMAEPSKADSVRKTAPPKPMNERMFVVDAIGHPELKVYKDVLFEVTKDCKTFNAEEAKTDWGMMNIEKTTKNDENKVVFSLPLSGPLRTYEVTAKPVKDNNMEAMMQKYGDLYAAYKQNLNEAEKADLAREEQLKNEQGIYEDVFEKYAELQRQTAVLYNNVSEASQVVYRTFQVKQFGIWNSDCPSSMPQGVEVFAKFENKSGEEIKIAAVYLVEKGKNALYNLYVPKQFSFNPDAENVLLVITNKGKLGWVSNEIFQNIDKSTKNYTFKIQLLDKESYTAKDIDGIVS